MVSSTSLALIPDATITNTINLVLLAISLLTSSSVTTGEINVGFSEISILILLSMILVFPTSTPRYSTSTSRFFLFLFYIYIYLFFIPL